MDRPRAARRGAIALGTTYLVLGTIETVRLTVTGDGGFLFWFGTLVGGGTLLLWGSRRAGRTPAVLVGALIGLPGTAWTVVVPLGALTVVALAVLAMPSPDAQGRRGEPLQRG